MVSVLNDLIPKKKPSVLSDLVSPPEIQPKGVLTDLVSPQRPANNVPQRDILSDFDPEGGGYDDRSARDIPVDPVTGHGASRNPITGQMLKGRGYKTWNLGVQGETEAGHQIYKDEKTGKYFSQPADNVDNSSFLNPVGGTLDTDEITAGQGEDQGRKSGGGNLFAPEPSQFQPFQFQPPLLLSGASTDPQSIPSLRRLASRIKDVEFDINIGKETAGQLEEEFVAEFSKMTPAERVAEKASMDWFNLFGAREFLSRYGLQPGENFGNLPGFYAIRQRAFDRVNQDAGVVEKSATALTSGVPKVAMEFLLAGGILKPLGTLGGAVPRTGATFGLHETLQAPREGESVLGRVKSVGRATGTGILVGTAGKLIPKAKVRVPVVVGGFGAATYAETGGDIDATIETMVTVLGFEALGMASRAEQYFRGRLAGKAIEHIPRELDAITEEITKGKDVERARAERRKGNPIPDDLLKKYAGVDKQERPDAKSRQVQPDKPVVRQEQQEPTGGRAVPEKGAGRAPDVGTEVVAADKAGVEIATQANKVEAKLSSFVNKAIEREQKAQFGQAALDFLEENEITPKQVTKEFWENTFPKLDKATQDVFIKKLQQNAGLSIGDVVSVNTKDGSTVVAKTHKEIVEVMDGDMPGTVDGLEGTDRGYIVELALANEVFKIQGAADAAGVKEKKGGTVAEFENIGKQQLGEPEKAMLKATTHTSGPFSFLLEHVGDLTQRITENVAGGKAGFGAVTSKLRRSLEFLVEGQFGKSFAEVFERSIKINADFSKQTKAQFKKILTDNANAFADAHAKLPVFNEVQRRARDAAIAIGRQDFVIAEKHLRWLQDLHDQGESAWNREALKGLRTPAPPAAKGGTQVVAAEVKVEQPPEKGAVVTEVYRGGYDAYMPRDGTALDVVNYEERELFNHIDLDISKEELASIPASDLNWVTLTKQEASDYGPPRKLSGRFRIIARDQDGGYLVQKIREAGREAADKTGVKSDQSQEMKTAISLDGGVSGGMLISPSARSKGKIQVTTFTKDGKPSGHDEFETLEDALLENIKSIDDKVFKPLSNPKEVKKYIKAWEKAKFDSPLSPDTKGKDFVYISPLRPLSGVSNIEGVVVDVENVGVLFIDKPLGVDQVKHLSLVPFSEKSKRASISDYIKENNLLTASKPPIKELPDATQKRKDQLPVEAGTQQAKIESTQAKIDEQKQSKEVEPPADNELTDFKGTLTDEHRTQTRDVLKATLDTPTDDLGQFDIKAASLPAGRAAKHVMVGRLQAAGLSDQFKITVSPVQGGTAIIRVRRTTTELPDALQDEVTPAGPVALPKDVVKQNKTSLPEELHGAVFFKRSDGLRVDRRSHPKGFKGPNGRRRAFLPVQYSRDLVTLFASNENKELLRVVKALTNEIIEVKVRRGKFWSTDHRLVPGDILEQARKHIVENKGKLSAAAFKKAIARAERKNLKATPRVVKKAVRNIIKPEVPKEEKILTPIQAMKFALRYESKGSLRGYRAGQLDLQTNVKEIAEFAKDHLPQTELGRILPVIHKVRTPGERRTIIKAINQIQRNIEKRVAIDRFHDAVKKLDLKHLQAVQRKQVEGILDSFSDPKPGKQLVKRMESLQKHLDITVDPDVPNSLVDRMFKVFADIDKPTLRDMTPQEIDAITKGIQHLLHLSRTKNQMLAVRKHRTETENITDATKEMTDRHPPKLGLTEGSRDILPAKSSAARILKERQLSPDSISFDLGGGKGALRDLLFNGLREGQRKTADYNMWVKDNLGEILTENKVSFDTLKQWSAPFTQTRRGKTDANIVSIDLPRATAEDGRRVKTLEMTVGEMMELHNFWQDLSNRERLTANKSLGLTFPGRISRAVKMTADDVRAVLEQLTNQQKAVAQGLLDFHNNEAQQRFDTVWFNEHGFSIVNPEKIHWPRTTDADYSKDTRLNDPDKIMQRWFNTHLDQQGIFQPRTKSVGPYVIDDIFRKYMVYTNRVGAYIGKSAVSQDAMRLVKDRNFRNQVKIRFKGGAQLLRQIEDTIKDFRGLDAAPNKEFEALSRSFLNKAQVGILALKVQIWLYQPLSYLTAAAEISPVHLGKFWNFRLAGNKEINAEIREHSSELRARFEGVGAQIISPQNAGISMRQFWTGQEGWWKRNQLKGISKFDQFVIVNLWTAAKSEMKAAGFTGKELLEKTARRTEEIVDRTQPTWDLLTTSDLARESRTSLATKMATLFSSQRNKNFNIVFRAASEYNHSEKTAADKAKFSRIATLVIMLQAAGVYAMGEWWKMFATGTTRLITGSEPDEDDNKRVFDHIWGITKRALGSWLIAGDVLSLVGEQVKNAAQDKSFWNIHGVDNPISAAIKDVLEGAFFLSKATFDFAKDEEASKSFFRGAASSLEGAGLLTGLPFSGALQLWRLILKGMEDADSNSGVLRRSRRSRRRSRRQKR